MDHPENWPALAACLAEATVKRPWEASVLDWLAERKPAGEMGGPQGRETAIGLACSGGADSLFLLLQWWERFPGRRGQTIVLHVNHGLRGADSDTDAAFVEKTAAALGLSFRGADSACGANPSSDPALGKMSPSEADLRAERMKFFAGAGCAAILQGHQRDDVAETMLMRLARGAGLEGLSAPRPVSEVGGLTFLRPFLDWPRADIRRLLRECGIPWREDSSNAGRDYLRNRIRLDVLPALRKAVGERDPDAGFARSRRLLEEDAEHIASVVAQSLANVSGDVSFEARLVQNQPQAIGRRALLRWLVDHGMEPSAAGFEDLLAKLKTGAPFRFSAGGRLLRSDGKRLFVESASSDERPDFSATLWPGQSIDLPGGVLTVLREKMPAERRAAVLSGSFSEKETAFLDASVLPGDCLSVRPWQPGDRYQPLGASGSRKLQDAFVDKKISLAERRLLPVVTTSDGQIAWVPGLPPANKYQIDANTEQALVLTYRRNMAMMTRLPDE